jgi:hypothetical protein
MQSNPHKSANNAGSEPLPPSSFDSLSESRQAANLARISMPTAKQKFSAPAPSCPATNRTAAMEGKGGDYLISLRKEGSHRSHSIVRVALIAPGLRCKSRYCDLTHFRQSSFPPHVDPPFPRRSQNVLAPSPASERVTYRRLENPGTCMGVPPVTALRPPLIQMF